MDIVSFKINGCFYNARVDSEIQLNLGKIVEGGNIDACIKSIKKGENHSKQ